MQKTFTKNIKEITAQDRYLYEKLPTLPDGVILIDLEEEENTRYGALPLSDTAINDLVRFIKDLVKARLWEERKTRID